MYQQDFFDTFGHIPFEGLPNTRDLGGMPASDGRFIVPFRLLRSGLLDAASGDDLIRLKRDYHVTCIVDFRTPGERKGDPDPLHAFEHVAYLALPAISHAAVGLTRDGNLSTELAMVKEFLGDPHAKMRGLYEEVLLADYGLKAYAGLLDAALTLEDGALLWHCSEGKDRAGMGSALIEFALGVPKEAIEADYLATNLFVSRSTSGLSELLVRFDLGASIDEALDAMKSVRLDYFQAGIDAVEREYGSVYAYMDQALDFGPEKRAALREKYLEG